MYLDTCIDSRSVQASDYHDMYTYTHIVVCLGCFKDTELYPESIEVDHGKYLFRCSSCNSVNEVFVD